MKQEISSKEEYKEVMLKYEFAKKVLQTEIDILLGEYEFNTGYTIVEHIKSRIKNLDSAICKLKKKGYPVDVSNLTSHVHDMIGFRIVCSFLSDVYEIVNIIKSSKRFKVKDESDYIKEPKSSGYISYHLNILVPIYWSDKIEYIEAEVQIRTIAMDFWASLDHKLRYKILDDIPNKLEKEMLNCSDDIRFLDVKMQHLYETVKNMRHNN